VGGVGFIGQHRAHRRLRRRGLAVAFAVAAHLILFAGLLWRIEPPVKLDTAPVMQVDLVGPWPTPLPHHAPAAPRSRSETAPWVQDVAPPDIAPRPVTPSPADAGPGPGELRAALRGRLGCDHPGLVGLSAAERQACQDRLARARPADGRANSAHLDLSRGGALAGGDGEPFLARKPHNGCVPNVAEKETGTVGAVRQDWTAGINCAWSF